MGAGNPIIVYVYMGQWSRQAKNLEENAPHPTPPPSPSPTLSNTSQEK